MTAKHLSEKSWNCVMFERAPALGSTPGRARQTRLGKSADAWAVSLAKLMVLSLLCAASIGAASPRYQVIDLGSLGGPRSYAFFSGVVCRLLNNNGTATGGMDTSTPDPFCFNSDCLTSHAFEWTNGFLADLGTLEHNDAGNFSQASWINDQNIIVGVSTYNALGGSGEPLLKAVMWTNGQIVDLGTLGGNQSFAQSINNHGQAVGWALDLITETNNIWQDYPFPFGTRQRATLWDKGVAIDLGTLGGPCAWATDINDNGQIIGQSLTSALGDGTMHQINDAFFYRPAAGFLWENGAITNLGNLGGTWALPTRINNQGQVIGHMSLANDRSYHPFLWEKGMLRDLGTFGGETGMALAMNESGEVVGGAALATEFWRAFLWKNGVMMNLGTLGQVHSRALAVNSKTQIVGKSWTGSADNRAFIWENGGPMQDLNALVPEGSARLADGMGINERGEILCAGENYESAFLLIPAPHVTIRNSNTASGQGIAIEMQVIPGRHYSLQVSADLLSWTALGTEFTAQTDTVTRELATVPGGQFYRLVVLR
jgi:probable HAF family extracellular repeat protein